MNIVILFKSSKVSETILFNLIFPSGLFNCCIAGLIMLKIPFKIGFIELNNEIERANTAISFSL